MRKLIKRRESNSQRDWHPIFSILFRYHKSISLFTFGIFLYYISNADVLNTDNIIILSPSPRPISLDDSSSNLRTSIPNDVGDVSVEKLPSSDGNLNGIPVVYKEAKSMFSKASCVGENFGENSWQYRSCEFRNLCFDLEEGQYVIYKSAEEKKLDEMVSKREDKLVTLQNLVQRRVVAGALNDRWRIQAMRWFPRIFDDPYTGGYYEIPDDVVLVPFRSYFAKNPGHLVWDNFLPIFHLLSIFGLEKQKLFLLRAVPELRPFDYCDSSDEWMKECQQMFDKFLPVMNHATLASTKTLNLDIKGKRKSNLVCAKHGAAGMAMLADHGLGQHGKVQNDYKGSLNVGRGPIMRMFRDYMLKNLGFTESHPTSSLELPVRVTVSRLSSRKPRRSTSFDHEAEYLRSKFASDEVDVTSYTFKAHNVTEQAKIASNTDIMITQTGGGAIQATFLPPGSSLILFYDEVGGFEDLNNKQKKIPARLDFDLLNNAGYFKTHWLPTGNLTEDGNLTSIETVETLESIIRAEVEWRISQKRR